MSSLYENHAMSCILRQQIFGGFELLIFFLFKILGQRIELTQHTHASGSQAQRGKKHLIRKKKIQSCMDARDGERKEGQQGVYSQSKV